MELFVNDKGILFIKSLRIEKYITLWKNRTYLLVFQIHQRFLLPRRVSVNPRLPFPESPSSFWPGSVDNGLG